jgi:hypothetical protein
MSPAHPSSFLLRTLEGKTVKLPPQLEKKGVCAKFFPCILQIIVSKSLADDSLTGELFLPSNQGDHRWL